MTTQSAVCEVTGRPAVTSTDFVVVADVNQYMARFLDETGRRSQIKVEANVRSSARLFEYARTGAARPGIGGARIAGRRTVDGRRVVIAISKHMIQTFIDTLAKEYAVAPSESEKWLVMLLSKFRAADALRLSNVEWDRKELNAQADRCGVPDGEDLSVYLTMQRSRAEAIVGLDIDFRDAVRAHGFQWLELADVLALMPA